MKMTTDRCYREIMDRKDQTTVAEADEKLAKDAMWVDTEKAVEYVELV